MLTRILIARLRSLILRRWEYPPENPNILWSKGWYSVADWSGDNNYAYPAYPTRYRIQSLKSLVGKRGIIWLRLGSDPPKPEFENGAPGDLVIFGRDVIGKLSGPVALITTDGDRTIPTGLPGDVVQKIINDTNIKVWYSQNLVTPSPISKMSPEDRPMSTYLRGVDFKDLQNDLETSCGINFESFMMTYPYTVTPDRAPRA